MFNWRYLTKAGAYVAARMRLSAFQRSLAESLGFCVKSGPFAGMKLPRNFSWGGGMLAPKVLGCYEAELHPALEKAIERAPEVVVNVGCAEGFYAIGLARRLPNAKVYAFDIDKKALEVCAVSACENGVGERVEIRGLCDAEALLELASGARRMLVVMDCEGAEIDLVNEKVGALKNCDFVIECHDFFNPRIMPSLSERLAPTHALEKFREGARDPSAFEALQKFSSLDRALAVCEFRRELTWWLVAWGA